MKRNKTILQLPFKGFWFTGWGGDTEKLNRHRKFIKEAPNQKYAFDFLIANKKGNTYKRRGKNNKDYYAFGKEILSPADGVVIEAVDGVRDNKPGIRGVYGGNKILIKHQRGEISYFAHFKQGSIKVRIGDRVKKGQVIGLCGNSGRSTQPHLHYHLQDNEIIQDGKGIKCYFQNVKIRKANKAEHIDEYSPIKGDIVSNHLQPRRVNKPLNWGSKRPYTD